MFWTNNKKKFKEHFKINKELSFGNQIFLIRVSYDEFFAIINENKNAHLNVSQIIFSYVKENLIIEEFDKLFAIRQGFIESGQIDIINSFDYLYNSHLLLEEVASVLTDDFVSKYSNIANYKCNELASYFSGNIKRIHDIRESVHTCSFYSDFRKSFIKDFHEDIVLYLNNCSFFIEHYNYDFKFGIHNETPYYNIEEVLYDPMLTFYENINVFLDLDTFFKAIRKIEVELYYNTNEKQEFIKKALLTDILAKKPSKAFEVKKINNNDAIYLYLKPLKEYEDGIISQFEIIAIDKENNKEVSFDYIYNLFNK